MGWIKTKRPSGRSMPARIFCLIPFLTAVALLTTACDLITGVSPTADQGLGANAGAMQSNEIQLEAGDKLRVTVFGEDKLSGDYQVNTAGYVSLPLAGSVKVSGMTGPELERALE